MYEKRYYVSVAYASRYIYALGGHNGENQGRLDTAERYNLDENLWQPIASMNRVRSDAAAAELKNRVYVAGGFEGRSRNRMGTESRCTLPTCVGGGS
nr:unnamed protein product [Spirometra erinaceieuropaei]